MNTALGHINLLGIDWEVEIEYVDFGEGEIELEQAHLIGVYLRGDNIRRRDYTSMTCSIPLDPSELTGVAYDRLLEIAAADSRECQYDR
jgi:hypothetical protein